VLRHRKEFIIIDDVTTYKRPRVQLRAQGIVLRDEVLGALIKTKKQQICRAGELLVAEIDAKAGGFGIVPEQLDGAIVSSHYFLFEIDGSTLVRPFLDYFLRTPFFRDQVQAQGSTNYASIRPVDVLGYEIPLPPLAEQQRIVGRIEELSAKVKKARVLQQEVAEGAQTLLRSLLVGDGARVLTPMRELVRLRQPDVMVQPNEEYQFAGVYSFGRGVFMSQRRAGTEFAYPRLTTLRAGDFVYPKLMAWEGAFGITPTECDGCVVSTEFPVFEVDRSKVLPEVLDAYFKQPTIWQEISGASTGTNVRRRRLNPSDFLRHQFPLPTWETQLRLRNIAERIHAITPMQTETSAVLGALLRSILDRAFKGEL
jgi:type I restriction enzyme S subunit